MQADDIIPRVTGPQPAGRGRLDFARLFDFAADLLCIANTQGRFVEVSASWVDLLGYEMGHLLATPIIEFVHPDDRAATRASQTAIYGGLTSRAFVNRYRHADGHYIWLEWSARQHDGLIYAVARDITTRRWNEQLMAGEQQVLTEIVSGAPLPDVFALACRIIEELTDGALCSILTYDPVSRTLHIGAAPSLPPLYNACIDGVPVGPSVGSCGTAVWRRAPVLVRDIATDPLWLPDYSTIAARFGLASCWSTPLFDRDGQVLGTFALYWRTPHEPTAQEAEAVRRMAQATAIAIQQQNAERALVAAKDDAERASRAKSSFLASMSHELRTPLNAIIGFSDILAGETFGPIANPAYRDYARDINRSGLHLLDLINDILDVSRIEAGKMEMNEEPVDLGRVVTDCVRLVTADPRHRPVDLRLSLPEAPLVVRADPRASRQVVLNLLSNAVKFTDDGHVAVTLRRGRDVVEIVVADTGVGIPEHRLAALGQPFTQVEDVMNRRREGTGMGLFITRSLLEMHGGRLVIESRAGIGTTVTAALPLHRLIGPGAQPA